ncbi:Amuc_1099 family pilus-like system protein [Luteolibacter luteus]|uniref:Uncharacterized protein n=1 Tax=Luteolibacter luteus TaxID=2728835 RepID=A0A858RL13_9BACT|nr:Amuc_1099 family pilus-like system protein [Luteolibacter luteus]QJE97148.1 hypothetical protein HHL09_15575 [Luteolibacter luteus]
MSKLPKNFEKILVGVAGVAALGCAALGFMNFSAVGTDFAHQLKGNGAKDPTIPQATATTKATNSLTSNRVFEKSEDSAGRAVNLFIGVPLFANKNNPNVPVDPFKGDAIHPPIPNKWWIDNGADMTFANSPSRDDDNDGYTNLEEFEAKTKPTDPKSVPPLIDKLVFVKDESTMWYVQFGFESEGKWSPRFTGLTFDNKRLQNKVSALEMMSPGDTFFKDGAMANRFKFTGMIEKEITSAKTKLTQNVKFAQYEDLKENKKGEKYESQANLPEAELQANAYYDRTAVLDLKAIGFEGKEFKVEERTKFALPPDAPEKNYTLKKVTPGSIEVEYTDAQGQTQTKEIAKGTP